MRARTRQMLLDELDAMGLAMEDDRAFPSNAKERAVAQVHASLNRMVHRLDSYSSKDRGAANDIDANIKIKQRKRK